LDFRAGIDKLSNKWASACANNFGHEAHLLCPLLISTDVIRHTVWLYFRFTLSYWDVEDLLAERGLTVSNESIRLWVYKFGALIAKNLRALSRWRLDEIDGLNRWTANVALSRRFGLAVTLAVLPPSSRV
jgi:hypothetical protein